MAAIVTCVCPSSSKCGAQTWSRFRRLPRQCCRQPSPQAQHGNYHPTTHRLSRQTPKDCQTRHWLRFPKPLPHGAIGSKPRPSLAVGNAGNMGLALCHIRHATSPLRCRRPANGGTRLRHRFDRVGRARHGCVGRTVCVSPKPLPRLTRL